MDKVSNIYIDGFNLYYGALQGTKWKWLNLERFFDRLRQSDEIREIKYFTAEVLGSHLKNQQDYLLALETLPKVRILLGKFKSRTHTCGITRCRYKGSRLYTKPEEKRTDVNIAVHMVYDALLGGVERVVLVTGDSDLVPALKMIKTMKPSIELIVYVPARDRSRGAAVELRGVADKQKTLPMDLLKHCQFPSQVSNGCGGLISKPSDW